MPLLMLRFNGCDDGQVFYTSVQVWLPNIEAL